MVMRFRKKITRQRGSHTHGYGAKKKHRGKGSKGGKGYAGSTKHKLNYIRKYEPWHFKHKKNKPKPKGKTINVSELGKQLKNAKDRKTINLKNLGYSKLLGKGKADENLTGVKIVVRKVSKKAKEKLEKVGAIVSD
ncbi:MAG: uL15 family ribosomal protein [Candidatus Aenigmarchaeota archaeon]|nr:uL15 family ribosomal protein [Candidatus Aenigmarchaeota archaeon]